VDPADPAPDSDSDPQHWFHQLTFSQDVSLNPLNIIQSSGTFCICPDVFNTLMPYLSYFLKGAKFYKNF
jgi:hypothetical protein